MAALVRFPLLSLSTITADEGIHGMFAMNVAIFRDWPLVGLPSVGIRNSALFIYMLAIPYAIVRHPLAGVGFVAALNVWAVWLCYRVGRRLGGHATGVVAALLYALSPWGVAYARTMWPPSCLAPFVLLFLEQVMAWLDDHRPSRTDKLVIAAFVLPQLHFSAFAAPVFLCFLFTFYFRLVPWRRVCVSALIGLATWTPWLYWQHVDNHWVDLSAAWSSGQARGEFIATGLDVVKNFRGLLHSGRMEYWYGHTFDQLPEFFPAWLRAMAWASAVILFVLWVLTIGFILRRGTTADRWLLFWSVLPSLLLWFIRPVIHPHYVLVAYPVPFVIMARTFVVLVSQISPTLRRNLVALSILSLVTLTHASINVGWFRYLAADRPDGSGHFELTYRQRFDVADAILHDAGQRRVNLVGPFNGQAPAYNFVYNYEQMRRGYARYRVDRDHVYWVDEGQHIIPGYDSDDYEKEWRVGPTRVVLLRLRHRRD